MPAIRDISKLAEKYQRVTPAREAEYRFGVENPKEKWSEEAVKASGAWKSGVQDAAAKDLYAKGVAKVGDAKWQRNAIRKGVEQRRWATEVAVAGPAYQTGFAPYAETIKATSLPPRGAKGDPRNIDRVAAMAAALRAKKLELKGAK